MTSTLENALCWHVSSVTERYVAIIDVPPCALWAMLLVVGISDTFLVNFCGYCWHHSSMSLSWLPPGMVVTCTSTNGDRVAVMAFRIQAVCSYSL